MRIRFGTLLSKMPVVSAATGLLSAAVLAAALPFLFALPAWAADAAVIVADRLNVRPEPGTEKTPIATLNRGDRIRVVKNHGDWLEIAFGEYSGFIRNREQYVRILPATGFEGGSSGMDEAQVREKAEAIAEKIERDEKALARVRRQESAVMERLDDIGRNLNRARKRIAELHRGLADLELEIQKIRTEIDELKKEIDQIETDGAKRLVAYYKLQWFGTAQLLVSADSLAEMIYRKAALERIIESDQVLWSKWTERRRHLDSALAALDARKQEKISVEKELAGRIAEMNREKRLKADLLEEIRQSKALRLAAIDSLKDAAGELEKALERLRSQDRSPAGTPAVQIRDFAELKGLLPLPVRGKIVTRFGKYRNPEFNVVNFRSGIDIRAERGEPIHAVSAGRVLFAEWFKGYGNMIIVDHGLFYYTVYAHAEELFKKKGETVQTGEVIATVGDTGSMIGPSLYFEIRHHGKPLDPRDWLNAG
ncbi:MAG: peptidoglycan DD-metalloendopeptidase family protein [Desulfobacterales bacterium]|jgi:septal ring factor EnvC (AmiA/AmiB activator)